MRGTFSTKTRQTQALPGILRAFFILCCLVSANGCSKSDLKDAVDLAEGVPRKTINQGKLGVNAFANDSRFGTPAEQYNEIRSTLGLRYVRVLFNWNDQVQPSPESSPNFGFYDEILQSVPDDVEVLVVLNGLPSWMTNPGNWSAGNPRTTFVNRWVRPVVERYQGKNNLRAFQIWNEPNQAANAENQVLGLIDEPAHYVELLASAYSVIKDVTPGKEVVTAATTAVNQNYPSSLNYNRGMRDAGAREFSDVWAIHYYGKQFENVLREGGVEDFLDDLNARIWVTESGAQGVDEQLEYGEQVWPFLFDEIARLERVYVYQFTEDSSPATTYGLKNPSTDRPVSDLYVELRDK